MNSVTSKRKLRNLKLKQSALRNDLKSLGLGTYVGDQYVLTISESKRECWIWMP